MARRPPLRQQELQIAGYGSTCEAYHRVRLVARKVHVEHAIANCIAFGSKNSAMLLRRV